MPERDPGDLNEECRRLVERLGGRWSGYAGLCRCPAHDDRRPSLSVRIGRRRLLLHCFAGCSAGEILKSLRAAGQPIETVSGSSSSESGTARQAERSRAAAIRLWGVARPIAGTPVERYLMGRGLAAESSELRYHPRAPHGPAPLTRFRPAMVAAVRDDIGVVAVHRTFLNARWGALAPIDEPRCGLGRFGSGAVRLGGTAPRLGLAEGVETALSASALFGIPCWATLGTERFRLVALPDEVEELILFLDHDAGGRRAEALARETFRKLAIEARYPRERGADWNDVLRAMPRDRGR
jgi:putative DNA primase/helicase